MATVDKNFRIKNGLAVEGTTATVNGNDILTKNTQDGDSYIINLIGGSADTANTPNAVVKRDGSGNFAAGQITVTDINIGTIGHIYDDGDLIIANTDGQDVILQGEDIRLNAQDDVRLNAGTGGDVFIQATSGNINLQGPNVYVGENLNYVDAERVASQGYVDDSIANIDLTFNTDEISEGTTNLYFTDGRAQQAAAAIVAEGIKTDINGPGGATRIVADTDVLATKTYAETVAGNAQDAAETYADGLINDGSTTSTNVWSAYKTSTEIGLAQAAAEGYADDAVAALVGSAPAVLDTIQELATALENNPDIIADLENVAAGKQDTLTAGSNIDITGTTISVTGLDAADISDFNTAALSATSAAYDAAGAAAAAQTAAEGFATTAANNAQSAAEDYADGLAGNYEASGNVESAVNNLVDGTTQFTEVSIGWMTDEVAAYVNANTDAQVTAYSWNKYKGASAKFIVRMRNGIHSQVSEILLTRDNSDNIAITEYGIVTTNGILGDITAAVNGSDIDLKVTPEHNTGTEIIVSGTLMSYGD